MIPKENEAESRKRNLKVHYGYYEFDKNGRHPMIRIKGKYLSRFDFNVGDLIVVSINKGHIIIQKVENMPS